jgi:PTS hybrid protein
MDGGNADPGYVSLVLVSHSHRVAIGTAELVIQVAGHVTVLAIGGAKDGSLGTDGQRVAHALECAASTGGGVVLADIGSSVLSVLAAVAELCPAQRESVVLADAPFIEGALAAAIAASSGASLEDIVCAAEKARYATKL